MIIESLNDSERFNADVCIVGAGPVGISLAIELASAQKRVLILESGGLKPSADKQQLSRTHVLDRTVHDDMTICVSRQVGGTSNLWGGRCLPLDPVDFADRASFVNGRWPISYVDIEPFFRRAALYCNCGPPVFEAPLKNLSRVDPRISITRIERYSNKPAFQRAHAETLATSKNIVICLNATVTDLIIAGGETVEAVVVRVSDETQKLPVKILALAMGGLETTRLLLSVQRAHPKLFGGRDGPLGRYYMGHLVGQVADITWTSQDIDASYDFCVDGNKSYVRRRMTPSLEVIVANDLPNVAFWPVVFPVSNARHGNAVLSLVYLALAFRPIGSLIVPEVIRRYHAPKGIRKIPHLLNVVRNLPAAINYLPSFVYRRYLARLRVPGFFLRNPSMTYGLSFHAEHFPSAESRVWLNDEEDEAGLPRLTIDFRFSRKDAESLARAHRILDRWLRDNNLGRITYRQHEDQTVEAILRIVKHGTHQIGTTRMARNRQEGVVDGNLKTFDLSNLYVVGSSVFPTSGQANPTFSAVALATRLADYLIRSSSSEAVT